MSLCLRAAVIAAVTLVSFNIAAQGWKPSRPVALVVGAAPGGSIDLTARLIQRTLDQQKLVPTPVIVINKPGAGQGIAWGYMIEKGGDGLALAMGGPSLVSNPVLGTHSIGYKDITTVAMLFAEAHLAPERLAQLAVGAAGFGAFDHPCEHVVARVVRRASQCI